MLSKKTESRHGRAPRGGAAQKKIRALLPVPFRSHLKASIREGLLAFESLFDEAVKALEKEKGRKANGRGRKIKVH